MVVSVIVKNRVQDNSKVYLWLFMTRQTRELQIYHIHTSFNLKIIHAWTKDSIISSIIWMPWVDKYLPLVIILAYFENIKSGVSGIDKSCTKNNNFIHLHREKIIMSMDADFFFTRNLENIFAYMWMFCTLPLQYSNKMYIIHLKT